jgi:16S rRNA (adenine1518-N6/adenine1519-N6)-dimethyltransferase
MNAPGLLGARRVRELLASHGVIPRKALGQNFVVDPNTIRKVLDAADVSGSDSVLEIGPGVGSLTLGLAAAAKRVIAIELDEKLIPVLDEALAGVDNVQLIQGDVMRIDLSALGIDAAVANLPYNIAVPAVLKLLDEAHGLTSATVMTQREVGERLAASPGSKLYGQPSATAAYYARVRVVTTISRRAFFPTPNVDSVLIRLDRRDPPDVDKQLLFRVIRASFSQRRKKLRNNLTQVSGSTSTAERALLAAGLDPATRAEQVSLEEFVRIASAIRG